MHPFYNNTTFKSGSLVKVREQDHPPTFDNPTGKSIRCYDGEMHLVGCLSPETQLIVLERPKTAFATGERVSMFVHVVSPQFGHVWVRSCDIEYAG